MVSLRSLAVLALVLVPGLLTAQVPADQAARVARIERGLPPSVAVAGRPIPVATIEQRMARYQVPGVSIAVFDSGRILWAKGYGMADAAKGTPVTTSTLFQAASISKPVSAAGMLKLVEAGTLDLDADINDVLTSWKLPRYDFDGTVTLRRLASHTAGVTVHGFPGYARGERIPTTAEVLDGKGNTAPIVVDTAPGTILRYSGGGYTIMQQAMEDATGTPFAALMDSLVLDPLGMSHSTFRQPLPEERWGEASSAHTDDGTVIPGDWHSYPEMAAAGLWTTPSDLARFLMGIQRSRAGEPGGLLEQATAETMLTPVINDYALGFGLPQPEGNRPPLNIFGHGGSNAGFRAEITGYLKHPSGMVIMTNAERGAPLIAEITRAIATEYRWEVRPVQVYPLVTFSPARRAALATRYTVEGSPARFALSWTADGLLHLSSENLNEGDLLPVKETMLIDGDNNRLLTIEWDGDRVVRILSQNGLAAVPEG